MMWERIFWSVGFPGFLGMAALVLIGRRNAIRTLEAGFVLNKDRLLALVEESGITANILVSDYDRRFSGLHFENLPENSSGRFWVDLIDLLERNTWYLEQLKYYLGIIAFLGVLYPVYLGLIFAPIIGSAGMIGFVLGGYFVSGACLLYGGLLVQDEVRSYFSIGECLDRTRE